MIHIFDQRSRALRGYLFLNLVRTCVVQLITEDFQPIIAYQVRITNLSI
jgi:hypothetical protein